MWKFSRLNANFSFYRPCSHFFHFIPRDFLSAVATSRQVKLPDYLDPRLFPKLIYNKAKGKAGKRERERVQTCRATTRDFSSISLTCCVARSQLVASGARTRATCTATPRAAPAFFGSSRAVPKKRNKRMNEYYMMNRLGCCFPPFFFLNLSSGPVGDASDGADLFFQWKERRRRRGKSI